MSSFPPGLIFIVGALLIALAPARARPVMMLALPLVGGLNLWTLWDGGSLVVSLFNYELELIRADRLSLLFGLLFHIAAFIGALFALHVGDRMQQVSAFLYAGAALGAVFAGDLITLFLFWEFAGISSVFLLWARRERASTEAGVRYILLQMVSGLMLLGGILIHVHETGSTAFEYIGLGGVGSILIFVAFGIKCAFPLVHTWLTDAYPAATPTATVFLSAFTTKMAVYALARGYPGTEVLIYIGTAMAAFPIFYAVIENDLRRVLAYSMINQIGFMVLGVGIGTDLALNGAVSHAFNDVIFKGLLLMTMGAVLQQTGKINGSEFGGLYKTMPWTTGFCIIGAASISAFPLFSGFVSKSMVMTAAIQEGHWEVWLIMLFASAGVFHHAGIKIPYFAFFAHDSGIRTKDPPLNMLLAMGISALLCIFIGVYPQLLYSLLPWPVDYEPYTGTHILAQIQLLFFSALAFIALNLLKLYPPELPSVNLDVDWVYRRLLPRAGRMLGDLVFALVAQTEAAMQKATQSAYVAITHHHRPTGVMARSWPTGLTTLWIVVLLGICLVIYYV